MKIAQELRTGNVVMVGGEPLVVQKAEYNKSGRNAAGVKMKPVPYTHPPPTKKKEGEVTGVAEY